MKTKITLILILICAYSLNAQTVGTLIVGAKTLDNTVNGAIEKADNVLSDQQRTVYINLLNYTSYLNGVIKSLGDDLDRNLTQKELAILNDVNTINEKLEGSIGDLINGLEDGTTIIENASTRIIGSDKYPSPTFFKIPMLTASQNKNIVIDVKGVRLNNSQNYIVFAGKKIPVTSISSDKLISFTVPLTEDDLFSPDSTNIFKLFLFEKRFIGKDKVHKYSPRFIVVPKNLATVKAFYKVHYEVKEESNGQTDIVHATSGSNKTKDVVKQFNVHNSSAEGWKIDKTSIKCWKESGSGDKHGYAGPYQNSMTDVSFVAKAFAKDGKATCRCNWNEYRMVSKYSIETSEVKIHFNQQEVISLPDNMVSLVRTEAQYYDGSIFKSASPYFKNNHIEFNFRQLEKLFEVKFTAN
ncbi:hypothetical protein [[Flexibacter] sp. ATCC 35103]|uniref:hypothetical protein n=1 Tax=[Flexibacter] sp. ATCC 35103 TaxID=1937528 RepID=UPI0009C83750|nr:hypothetical protein [[Flexibacter] sp. ATCC 35103]OMQ12370.1 hypothetical protein BXU01_05685 [[Flexibacter] sp. ATCC 35103]